MLAQCQLSLRLNKLCIILLFYQEYWIKILSLKTKMSNMAGRQMVVDYIKCFFEIVSYLQCLELCFFGRLLFFLLTDLFQKYPEIYQLDTRRINIVKTELLRNANRINTVDKFKGKLKEKTKI